MEEPLLLGPGSATPGWLVELETACFGDSFGPLGDHERVWAFPPAAFVRWAVVPLVAEGQLVRLAVDPGHRREGLARALLNLSEAVLRREGITILYLEVRVSNAGARTLYEREGWTFQGIRKAYYRNGEDAALYKKDL